MSDRGWQAASSWEGWSSWQDEAQDGQEWQWGRRSDQEDSQHSWQPPAHSQQNQDKEWQWWQSQDDQAEYQKWGSRGGHNNLEVEVKASDNQRRGGNRGHRSLDGLNARDRREIKQWRKDKDEKERLSYKVEQQEMQIQILEGCLWSEEDNVQELRKQQSAQKETISEMAACMDSMKQKIEQLHYEKVDSMKSRMESEAKSLTLAKTMNAKDKELVNMQAQLDLAEKKREEQVSSLFADFARFQAGQAARLEVCFVWLSSLEHVGKNFEQEHLLRFILCPRTSRKKDCQAGGRGGLLQHSPLFISNFKSALGNRLCQGDMTKKLTKLQKEKARRNS